MSGHHRTPSPDRDAAALLPLPHGHAEDDACDCPVCEGDAPPVVVDTDGYNIAVLSEDGRYRYLLTRPLIDAPAWDDRLLVYLMLNPSTADGHEDDPTVRRCKGFAQREGYAGIVVVNLYALRSPDPKALRAARDPVGPLNDAALRTVGRAAAARGHGLVAAWGAGHRTRGHAALALLRGEDAPVMCLGTTSDGSPRHPLYVRGDAPLVPYESTS